MGTVRGVHSHPSWAEGSLGSNPRAVFEECTRHLSGHGGNHGKHTPEVMQRDPKAKLLRHTKYFPFQLSFLNIFLGNYLTSFLHTIVSSEFSFWAVFFLQLFCFHAFSYSSFPFSNLYFTRFSLLKHVFSSFSFFPSLSKQFQTKHFLCQALPF